MKDGEKGVENLGKSSGVEKLLVLFDSDCGFCSRSVQVALGSWFRADCCARPFQAVDLSFHNLTVDKCAEALHCVAPDGTVTVGHEAVAAILRRSRRPWPLVGRAMLLPGGVTPCRVGLRRRCEEPPQASRRHGRVPPGAVMGT